MILDDYNERFEPGNFIKYTPLAQMLMIAQAPPLLLWGVGLVYSVGRVAHARGVILTYGPYPGRALGFFLTMLVYLIGAGFCLYLGIDLYFT